MRTRSATGTKRKVEETTIEEEVPVETAAKKTRGRKPKTETTNNNNNNNENNNENITNEYIPPPMPTEKRAAAYRAFASQDLKARISRAKNQRMFLITEKSVSTDGGELCGSYAVLGSTGNVYDVDICQFPKCSCPDHQRGNLCKHIVFVFLKVLKVDEKSPIIYQKALLQSELKEIFDKRKAATDVIANTTVVNAYLNATNTNDDKQEEGKHADAPLPDDECAICFELMNGGEALEQCRTCHKFLHKECLTQWLKHQTSCCYCRGTWVVPKTTSSSGNAGYMNFSKEQGGMRKQYDGSYYGYRGYGYRNYGWRYW
eukprot:TRINITY_DN68091_c3_g3_i1.p1 TRINITY_DN68091_c3_g3~~TRINITY_DN68091_c3_g3_i1.p1  ORF type:complete len:316 (-),score=23.45 TRINITY_DN68091_c3_g3_i1:136-1083(-)